MSPDCPSQASHEEGRGHRPLARLLDCGDVLDFKREGCLTPGLVILPLLIVMAAGNDHDLPEGRGGLGVHSGGSVQLNIYQCYLYEE